MNKFVDKDEKLNEEERLQKEYRIKKAKELDVVLFEGLIEPGIELAKLKKQHKELTEFKEYLDIQKIKFEERYDKAFQLYDADTTSKYSLWVGDKVLGIACSFVWEMNHDTQVMFATDELELDYSVRYLGKHSQEFCEQYREEIARLNMTSALELFHKIIREGFKS